MLAVYCWIDIVQAASIVGKTFEWYNKKNILTSHEVSFDLADGDLN